MGISAWFSKPKKCPDKTVLVVGGGLAGLSTICALRKLDDQVKIILVDPKDYCEIMWAAYRAPFDPDNTGKASLIRLDRFCEAYKVQHMATTVERLEETQATVKAVNSSGDHTVVKFDACVVATGADAPWEGLGRSLEGPRTASDRLAQMRSEGERLLGKTNPHRVVIVGGGLIGTELAGDLAAYAKKAGDVPNNNNNKITVIHSGPFLCHAMMHEPAGKKVQAQLEQLGVEIVLNEKATVSTNDAAAAAAAAHTVRLASDPQTDIPADVVLYTTGFQARNEFLRAQFPQALNERGWIQTDEYLRIESSSSSAVFAFGDCSPTLPNAGSIYFRTAPTLAKNIQTALLNNNSDTATTTKRDFQAVVTPFYPVCNTVGPNQGVFYSTAFWTTRFVPWLKNKTMFFMSARDVGIRKEFSLLVE